MLRVAILFVLMAAPVRGDVVSDVIDAVAGLEAANSALAAAEGTDDQIMALTRAVQALERSLSILRAAERRAHLSGATAQADLQANQEDIARLLAGLQSAGAPATASRLVHPSGPTGAARAAMLMADVVPGFQAKSAQAARDLQEIQRLDVAVADAQAAILTGAENLRRARIELAAQAGGGENADGAASAVTGELLAAAMTLQDLALAISESSSGSELASQPLSGALPSLVEGSVLRGFAPEAQHPGVSLATLPGAIVTAPAALTVRFQGSLPDYGRVVIAELAPQRLLVVTGIHDVFVDTGQVLPPGAPLGLMGGTEESASLSQFDRGALLTETLYVEARASGQPVDPNDWFALDKEQ